MIVPNHWAEARTSIRVNGRSLTLRRFGWSDDSPEDAQAQAELRVAEAAQRAASGERVPRRDLKLAYNGAEGVPIREEVMARHGEAVITRNIYGARCLNVPDLMIADVDFATHLTLWVRVVIRLAAMAIAAPLIAMGGSWQTWVAGVLVLLFGPSALRFALLQVQSRWLRPPAEEAVQRVRRFVSQHTGWRIRVYRTPAGLRLIATHAPLSPSSNEVRQFFDAVGADPVYVRMCLHQHCFRARLSAKPWRIGIGDHLKPRPGVWPIRAERMPQRAAWVARYEQAAAGYAACHYQETLGTGAEDARLQALVDLHDSESKALRHELALA